MHDETTTTTRAVRTGIVDIDGVGVFYREAGEPSKPKLVLLHGFPASSHQYRNLIPALAGDFPVIAMDYPGFGNSDMPDPATYPYTFDKTAEVVEIFLAKKGFTSFGLFVQDYGGPVGFRVLALHPEWLEWLVIQNTNAYEEGFTAAWDGFRNALWKQRTAETEEPLAAFLEVDAIRSIYLHGHKHPELISPDNWNMDSHFMERPQARRAQMDFFYDYRKNVTLYPEWQEFLRSHQPTTVIFWGQNDIFFTPEGGDAYLRDLPNAELHKLDSGHFAVEDSLDYIVGNIRRFYREQVAPGMPLAEDMSMRNGTSVMVDVSTTDGMSKADQMSMAKDMPMANDMSRMDANPMIGEPSTTKDEPMIAHDHGAQMSNADTEPRP